MFKSLLALGFIATTALAQSAYIGLPAAGAQLVAGRNYTFQVQRPVRHDLKNSIYPLPYTD